MTDREKMKAVAAADSCMVVNGVSCDICPVCNICASVSRSKGLAQQWLADHPEKPAEPETVSKYATRGESSYSLSLRAGRITIYHWHDNDSESVEFSGTAEDFNQFDESNPEEWFSLAAKMIAGKGKK